MTLNLSANANPGPNPTVTVTLTLTLTITLAITLTVTLTLPKVMLHRNVVNGFVPLNDTTTVTSSFRVSLEEPDG